ncbi:hypothetical protein C8R45DRAFT_940929 [Mycena sanguinolenta]|nr:hypothetical protein C8R45DRAFT_940929 [Mycena sanguinolenta]
MRQSKPPQLCARYPIYTSKPNASSRQAGEDAARKDGARIRRGVEWILREANLRVAENKIHSEAHGLEARCMAELEGKKKNERCCRSTKRPPRDARGEKGTERTEHRSRTATKIKMEWSSNANAYDDHTTPTIQYSRGKESQHRPQVQTRKKNEIDHGDQGRVGTRPLGKPKIDVKITIITTSAFLATRAWNARRGAEAKTNGIARRKKRKMKMCRAPGEARAVQAAARTRKQKNRTHEVPRGTRT